MKIPTGILRRKRKMLLGLMFVVGFSVSMINIYRSRDPSKTSSAILNLARLPYQNRYENIYNSVETIDTEKTKQSCVRPDLSRIDQTFPNFFRKLPPVICAEEKNWVKVWNGSIILETEAIARHGVIRCDYSPVLRTGGDFRIKYGATTKGIENGTLITHDHFKVECQATDGATYTNVHTGIRFDKSVRVADEYPPSSLGLSVLIIGYDSVSRLAMERHMPLTHTFFTKVLGGLVLKGYNVIGDGTVDNLEGILTGYNETELPEARKHVAGAKHFDGHPFIWKEFNNSGFVTQWAEDDAYMGCFTLRFLGFNAQPVHHYMRPYYLAAEQTYINNKPFCMGSVPRHQIMLNNIKESFFMYGNKPKFMFNFMGEFSHNDNNRLTFVDKDLKEFLEYLQEHGHLEKTLLILMSDHGSRFESFRKLPQGKMEERLPYFGLRFPSWFAEKHPEAMANLRTNTERLTNPRDVHATLRDVIHFTGTGMGNISNRAISLFNEIPKERRCSDAEIGVHWCACLQWEDIDPEVTEVKQAADAVIAYINDMTSSYRDDCELLSVENITKTSRLVWNRDVMRFKKTITRLVYDLSDNATSPETIYQLSFCVKPSHGCFETTVRFLLKTKVFAVDKTAISRINKYGNQPHCILEKNADLRKYCYCKSYMDKINSNI